MYSISLEAVGKKRGRPSEGAREALVEAAHDLFVERDYDLVSTEEILERSGVSRGALYHHFPTKVDLFRAVWEADERRLLEAIAAQVPAGASPFELLLAAARAYLRAAETDESLRRIGLLQSRAVLGWERWREASTELGVGVALARSALRLRPANCRRSIPRRWLTRPRSDDRGGDADRRRRRSGGGAGALGGGDRRPARGPASIASPA